MEATASKPPPAASNDVNSSSPEAQFHRLDKALLLKHLREVKAEITVNGKAFFKSYMKWEELSPTQRNKTISFWVLNQTDGAHCAIKTLVEFDVANKTTEEANRASITNKHDKAHLLHLCIDPSAAVLWNKALCEKCWRQFDDHNGQGGTVFPFDSLASMFNVPTNLYENACIVPKQMDGNGGT